MKTSIKTLFAAALTTIILGAASLDSNAKNITSGYTNLTSVKNISKIKVSGNVNLILVQDAKESIQVNDSYYTKNALVQQQDGELRISSFNKETLTVIAHVNNISSIEATNHANVSTSGVFNLLNLNVVLRNDATAEINSNTVSLTTNVNDQATLKLAGSTDQYDAVMGTVAKLNMNDFTATASSIRTSSLVNYASTEADDIYTDLLMTII